MSVQNNGESARGVVGEQKPIATYEPNITAVLCVDPYNDFLSEGGKLWPWVKDIAHEVNLLDNLRNIVRTARESDISIFHVPHHRMEPGDYENWKYPSLSTSGIKEPGLCQRLLGRYVP